MNNTIVSVDWLHEHLNDENLVILDARFISDPSESIEIIPGARWFDLKGNFSDQTSEFPNTFPSTEQFISEARKLGINRDSFIIVYDEKGYYTSARVWWMFKVMGHENVAVLDGGLPAWMEKKYRTEGTFSIPNNLGNFEAYPDLNRVKNIQFIEENIESKNYQVVDARSAGRFNGTQEEPRKGLRNGSIPNSQNLPYTDLLDGTKMKSKEELSRIFNNLNLDDRPVVFSCGSGVTACILLLGAVIIKEKDYFVYDGSWTEWATIHPES